MAQNSSVFMTSRGLRILEHRVEGVVGPDLHLRGAGGVEDPISKIAFWCSLDKIDNPKL